MSACDMKVWHGREGDGCFLRGGPGYIRQMLLKSGARWHGELRGWVMTLSQWQSFRMLYQKPVEELNWTDFELSEWVGRDPVVQGPFVAERRRRGPTYQTGGVYPSYQRPGR